MGGFADVLADLLGLPGAEQSDVSPDLELATELELAELAAELETADPMAAAEAKAAAEAVLSRLLQVSGNACGLRRKEAPPPAAVAR